MAAPFTRLPVSPMLMFTVNNAPGNADEGYRSSASSLFCYVVIDQGSTVRRGSRAYLAGSSTARMHQSVCAFDNIVVAVQTTKANTTLQQITEPFSLTLKFCVNTSRTRDPFVRQHPCNTSRIILAACPRSSTETMFSITPSRVFSGSDIRLQVVGWFRFADRLGSQCLLSDAGNASRVVAAQASMDSLCSIRCYFPASAYASILRTPSSLKNATAAGGSGGALLGLVRLRFSDGLVAAPTCFSMQRDAARASARRSSCYSHNNVSNVDPFPSLNCVLSIIGAPSGVNHVYSPVSGSIMLYNARVYPVATNISVDLCDAAGNAVSLFSPLSAPLSPINLSVTGLNSGSSFTLSASSAALSAPTIPNSSVLLSNLVVANASSSFASSPCGPRGMSIVLLPAGLFDMVPYCFSLRTGGVASLAIINSHEVQLFADTAGWMPVAPILAAFDYAGNEIAQLADTIAVSVVVSILQHTSSPDNASLAVVTTRSGVNVTRLPSPRFQISNVTAFPITLSDLIVFPQPGAGFGLAFEALPVNQPPGGLPLATVLLWDTQHDVVANTSYPHFRNVSVVSCGEPTSPPNTISTAVYAVTTSSCNGSVSRSGAPPIAFLSNTVPLAGGTVTITGWRFDWVLRLNYSCDFSNVSHPWSLQSVPNGQFTYISSCMATCSIPRQLFPIRAASLMGFDRSGNLVPSSTLTGIGALRIRSPSPSSSSRGGGSSMMTWSNALQVDVMGSAVGLKTVDYSPFYQKIPLTVISGFIVQVVDMLGSSLQFLDAAGPRAITLVSPARQYSQLNATAIRIVVKTCHSHDGGNLTGSGIAAIPPFALFSPPVGDYSLVLSSPGLMDTTLLLVISEQVRLDHQMRLMSPLPLCFNLVAGDGSQYGSLPVQPTIGLFKRINNTNQFEDKPDGAVSVVQAIAIVSPLTPGEPSSVSEGIDLNECSSTFGNCVFFSEGVATFAQSSIVSQNPQRLRFFGKPSHSYLVTIRLVNSSAPVNNVSFVVSVPYCPMSTGGVMDQIVAMLEPPLNASLAGPEDAGAVVKGWVFDIPPQVLALASPENGFSCPMTGYWPSNASSLSSSVDELNYACVFNGTRFPGRFLDICTVKCFTMDTLSSDPTFAFEEPPQGDNSSFPRASVCGSPSGSVSSCCYNATSGYTRCTTPVTSTLDVFTSAPLPVRAPEAVIPAGVYKFIGPPTSLQVLPNVEASNSIYTSVAVPMPGDPAEINSDFGHQFVMSDAAAVPLTAMIVSLMDSNNNAVGSTTSAREALLWIDAKKIIEQPLRPSQVVPGNISLLKIPGFDTSSSSLFTCFTEQKPPALQGKRVGTTTNGTFSFDNVSLLHPPAAVYALTIHAELRDPIETFEATYVVVVVPGLPAKICLWSDERNVFVQNGRLLNPQPVLLLLDAVGNIVQTTDEDPVFARRPFSIARQQKAVQSVSLTTRYFQKAWDFRVGFEVNQNLTSEDGNRTAPSDPLAWLHGWSEANTSLMSLVLQPGLETAGYSGVMVWEARYTTLQVSCQHSLQYTVQICATGLAASSNAVWALPPDDNGSTATDSLLGYDSGCIATSPFLLESCATGTFAIAGTDLCFPCPNGFDSCIGGSNGDCFVCNGSTVLQLVGNYWRYGPYAFSAYYCPSGSCLDNTETGECLPGYNQRAPLCDACDLGYAKDFVGKCVQCSPAWVSVTIIVFFAVAACVVIYAFVYLSVKGSMAESEDDNDLVMMLKIFVNFVQVTGMLGEFEVNFPGYVLSYFNFISAASGGSGISISPVNCLFPNITFLEKMDAQLGLPVLALLFVFLCLMVVYFRKLRKIKARRRLRELAAQESMLKFVERKFEEDDGDDNAEDNDDETDGGDRDVVIVRTTIADLSAKSSRDDDDEKEDEVEDTLSLRALMRVFGNASMILIFLMYQTIVTQCIATFNCLSIIKSPLPGDTLVVLESDVRVECQGTYYELHVALAAYGVCLFAVVLPLITMSLVLRQSRAHGWSETYQQFAFLIKGFRLKFWFWEFIVVFRKTGIRMLIATVRDATLQALLGIWFLTALFVAQTFAKPFVLSMHNHAEQLSLMTALVTLNIGLAFRSTGSTCGVICGVFSVLLIVLNVVVIAFFLVCIVLAVHGTVVEMFGIDNDKGERKLAIRNLKIYAASIFGRQDLLSPSFRTYTPKFVDAVLAKSVLGMDRIPDTNLAFASTGSPSQEQEQLRRRKEQEAEEREEEELLRIKSAAAAAAAAGAPAGGDADRSAGGRRPGRSNSVVSFLSPQGSSSITSASASRREDAGRPKSFLSIREAMAARRQATAATDPILEDFRGEEMHVIHDSGGNPGSLQVERAPLPILPLADCNDDPLEI
jgi:hypothetical protein